MTDNYGLISCMAVEPIEKKPIYHFFPNSKVLSVGGFGCSFKCDYCQNHKVSQTLNCNNCLYLSPSDLISKAKEHNVDGICFTYNEPLSIWKYIKDVIDEVKDNNLFVTLKTNGFCEEEKWDEVLDSVDAINLDIKGDAAIYNSICKISINDFKIVKSNIKKAISASNDNRCHLELSFPIYPVDFSCNSWVYDIVEELLTENKDIPLHLLRLFPAFNTSSSWKTSDIDNILKIQSRLEEIMYFVYIQNLFQENDDKYRSTYHPQSKKVLIKRKNLRSEIVDTEAYDFIKSNEFNHCNQ